jgi:hypothetical protein
VLLAQGGLHSGWSLYVKDGRSKFAYNYLGAVTTIASTEHLPAGRVTVSYDFLYDGGNPAQVAPERSSSTGKRSERGESNAPFRLFLVLRRRTWGWTSTRL